MDLELVDYEEFGNRFVETAVTIERVMAAVAGLGGDEIAVGPMTVGPGVRRQSSPPGR